MENKNVVREFNGETEIENALCFYCGTVHNWNEEDCEVYRGKLICSICYDEKFGFCNVCNTLHRYVDMNDEIVCDNCDEVLKFTNFVHEKYKVYGELLDELNNMYDYDFTRRNNVLKRYDNQLGELEEYSLKSLVEFYIEQYEGKIHVSKDTSNIEILKRLKEFFVILENTDEVNSDEV